MKLTHIDLLDLLSLVEYAKGDRVTDRREALIAAGLVYRCNQQSLTPLGKAVLNAAVARAEETLLAVQNGTTEINRSGYFVGGHTRVEPVSLNTVMDGHETAWRTIPDAMAGRLRNAFRLGEQRLADVKAGEVWYARFSGGLSGSSALYLIRLVEVTDVRVSYQSWYDWKDFQGTQRAMQPEYLEPYEFPKISHYMRHAVTFVERLELPDGD